MNEQQWQTCTDPHTMLDFIQGKASERKLRLFACACCRCIWDRLPTDACRKAVECAERYADGQASQRELNRAWSAVVTSAEEEGINLVDSYEKELIEWGTVPTGLAFLACLGLVGEGMVDAVKVASDAAQEVAWDAANRLRAGEEAESLIFHDTYSTEQAAQALLLRDVCKSPFRPLSFDSAQLRWNFGALRKLAQTIYESRAFDQIPVLADALEEAGCNNQEILGHLRGPGPHTRGCWPVDLILGRS